MSRLLVLALMLASSASAKKPWSDSIPAWYTADAHIAPADRIVELETGPDAAVDALVAALEAAGATDIQREEKAEEMRPHVQATYCHNAWKALFEAEAAVLEAPDRKAWERVEERSAWHVNNRCEDVEGVRADVGYRVTATVPDDTVLVVPLAEARAKTASALEFRVWSNQQGTAHVYGTGVALIDGIALGDPSKKLPLEWFDRINGQREAELVRTVLASLTPETP